MPFGDLQAINLYEVWVSVDIYLFLSTRGGILP
jgi:hypothetical protein